MKSILVLFLAVFVLGSAEEEKCPQLVTCSEPFLAAVFQDATDQERCDVLLTGIECLREKMRECDFVSNEMEKGIEEMQNSYNNACTDEGDTDYEVERCLGENDKYIMECIHVANNEHILEVIGGERKIEVDTLTCTMYDTQKCVLDKIGEKCGEEATEAIKQNMFHDTFDELKEACEKIREADTFPVMSFEKRK